MRISLSGQAENSEALEIVRETLNIAIFKLVLEVRNVKMNSDVS